MSALFAYRLLDHLLSLRFQAGLIAVCLLFVANGVIYTWKYERLRAAEPSAQREVDRGFQDLGSVDQGASTRFLALSTVSPSLFISEGGESWFGETFYVTAETGGGFSYGWRLRSGNHWMPRYEAIDWGLIVRLAVSFLCVVLAYDAVSGERERGTLRQVLTNPLSRARWFAARVLADLAVVMAIVSLGAVVDLALLSVTGVIGPSLDLAEDIFFFLLGAAVYALTFLCLATAVSAWTRTSATSLVVLILIWAAFVVVIPQTSYLFAAKGVQVEPDWRSRFWVRMGEVRQELSTQRLAPRDREAGRADGYAVEQRYLARLQEAESEEEARLQHSFREQVRQYRLARGVNMISPGYAFQYAVETLLGTGLPRYLDFERQAWRYRDVLREDLRALDLEVTDSPHLHFLPGYLSREPLDPQTLPRFRQQPVAMSSSLALGAVPVLLLVTEACLSLVLALFAVNRMEVTGS